MWRWIYRCGCVLIDPAVTLSSSSIKESWELGQVVTEKIFFHVDKPLEDMSVGDLNVCTLISSTLGMRWK